MWLTTVSVFVGWSDGEQVRRVPDGPRAERHRRPRRDAPSASRRLARRAVPPPDVVLRNGHRPVDRRARVGRVREAARGDRPPGHTGVAGAGGGRGSDTASSDGRGQGIDEWNGNRGAVEGRYLRRRSTRR